MPIAVYRQNISGFSIRDFLIPDVDTNELFSELSNQMHLLSLQVFINEPTHAEGILLSGLGEIPDVVNATLIMCGAPKLRRGGKLLLVNLPVECSEEDLLNTLRADYVTNQAKEAIFSNLEAKSQRK